MQEQMQELVAVLKSVHVVLVNFSQQQHQKHVRIAITGNIKMNMDSNHHHVLKNVVLVNIQTNKLAKQKMVVNLVPLERLTIKQDEPVVEFV